MKCASEILKSRRCFSSKTQRKNPFSHSWQPKIKTMYAHEMETKSTRAHFNRTMDEWMEMCHAHDAAIVTIYRHRHRYANIMMMIIIIVISMSSCPEMMQFSRKIYSLIYFFFSFSLIYVKQHTVSFVSFVTSIRRQINFAYNNG